MFDPKLTGFAVKFRELVFRYKHSNNQTLLLYPPTKARIVTDVSINQNTGVARDPLPSRETPLLEAFVQ